MDSIFIQIACYRDPQLVPTIEDLLENAKYPNNINIGIAWQHSQEDIWDNLNKFHNDSRFKIIDIPHNESLGTCWARSQIQKLYCDEKYTLQIDSHHRFVKDWDEILINMVKECQNDGYDKPLITAYLPDFDPNTIPERKTDKIWKMNFDKFAPEGFVMFRPGNIQNFDDISKPLKARFFSGHFTFTLGEFCLEVPYDPNYYFHGEEINMAVRAYTHGYDLFHPNKIIAWHEYTRSNRIKQWDDDKAWFEKNAASHVRNRKLFNMDDQDGTDFKEYGFGKIRSLEDYERYAGLSFKYRSVTKYTQNFYPPPDPSYAEPHEHFINSLISKYSIDIELQQELPNDDYDFWAIIIKDQNDIEIYREDAGTNEIKNIINSKAMIHREFYSGIEPNSWLVWPHTKSRGWLSPITGQW